MHREILPRLAEDIRDRATRAVRAQWAVLGPEAALGMGGERAAASLVDPEALVLASLGLVDHERRLAEVLGWWSARGSGLLSVQRMRNLAAGYPGRVRYRLREFAAHARAAGDHRWKAAVGSMTVGERPSGEAGEPRLDRAAATVLRLRLGLGVGIKADVMGVLLGREVWWRVRELASSTGYTARAVRRAVEELARGGWIVASPASPAEYRAEPGRWLPVLGLERACPWREWAGLFGLVLGVDAWVREEEWRGQGVEEAERSARRLVDAHRGAFKWSGVSVPPGSGAGAGYMRAFEAAVSGVAAWMEAEV